jgi:Flp pilus assembly protein TadD
VKQPVAFRLGLLGLLVGVIVALLAITQGRLRPVPPIPPPKPPEVAAPQPPQSAREEDFAFSDPRLNAAKEALMRRDFGAAFQFCKAAHKQGAAQPAILEMQAAIFKQTGYLDREIETLRQWTKTVPHEARPWIKLFYIYMDLGWRSEADQASRRALELAPKNARSHVTRAIFYYRSASPELGIAPIEEARRLDPNNTELANLHETILIQAKHFPEAEAQIRTTLISSPQKSLEQMTLVHALLGQNKTQEAETLLRDVQQREPDNVEAAYELGVRAQERGDLAEAKRQFEKVAALDSQFNNVLWRLGGIYRQEGRKEEGRKLLTTFETLDRNTIAYETAQNRLRTRPNNADIHYQLAKYHLAAQEIPQAIVELRRVLELRPEDAKARQDLRETLTRNGRLTEAKQVADTSSGQFKHP